MARYRISLAKLSKRLRTLSPQMKIAVIRGLQSAALRLEGIVVQEMDTAKPRPPIDTGELKRSVKTTQTRLGASITVDAPHAPFMEYGTRPHQPPIAPLVEWALRKGLADTEEEAMAVAVRVANRIAEKGIEPRFFFQSALERLASERIIEGEIRAELDELSKRPR